MAYHDVTGVLLVGGASSRFGSPKAVAQFGGEMLAERAYRILGESFPNAIAIGKADDRFRFSFEVVDDGSELRAPIVGVAAALRLRDTEIAVAVPTDMPLLTPTALRLLADAVEGYDAAVPQTGPLPGAYRRSALPVLERRIAGGRLALRDALAELETQEIALDSELLRNVNTRDDLEELARSPAPAETGAAGAGFPADVGSGP